MTPGAADAARRALREARERHARETAQDHDPPTEAAEPARPEGMEATPARPGGTEAEPGRPEGTTPERTTPAGTTPEGKPAEAAARRTAPGALPARAADAEPAAAGPRPGDAAREALRRAVAARRTPGDASEPQPTRTTPRAPGSASETEARTRPEPPRTPPARPWPSSTPDRLRSTAPQSESENHSEQRPADLAREALRVARKESRQAREDTERRRTPRPSHGPNPAALQLRDLGELLDGAFRMPTDEDETEATAEQRPTTHPTRETAAETGGEREAVRGVERGVASVLKTGAVADSDSDADSGSDFDSDADFDSGGSDSDPSSDADPLAPGPGPRQTPIPSAPLAPAPSVAAPAPQPPPPSPMPSTTPRSTPPSMAAPTRDGELRRTFPPFPPRPSARVPAEGAFAESWWGNAWVTALEEGALDVNRLLRGRRYADRGHVDAITVTPGLVLGYVQGSRPRPYRVQVRLRTLGDEAWTRFLEAAAERTGHIAALLDKELPHSLADCGVPLLPGPGDLDPQCSCPDIGHPCKHAAALCYQTARLLDADPFVLLLLRGRGERPLLDALSRLNATRAARAARDQGPAPLPGVRASEALARRQLPPLPGPLPLPPHPGQPPAYPAAPGGPDPFALDQLATDAAARAHALLSTGRDPVGELTLWQDAVRLAAARPGSGLTAATRTLYASLATATGRTTAQLARAVAAWRQGGIEGLAVLEDPWDPPAGRFDRARPLLLAADLPAFRPWRNHLTHPRGHAQLRLGRDGLWYAYESEPGHDDWWPRGSPDLDPVGALTAVAAGDDL
ncbi:SWIM zinc finger family protein [Streptomyces griseoviridis]